MAKIDSNYPVPLPLAPSVSRRASGSPVQAVESTGKTAGVGVTKDADEASAVRTAKSDAPVDAAKVGKLQAAILGGSYKVDSGRIADRLLDIEKSLS